jgi:hypothetical protein
MPGLEPGIHVFLDMSKQDVDGRVKPGHDEKSNHFQAVRERLKRFNAFRPGSQDEDGARVAYVAHPNPNCQTAQPRPVSRAVFRRSFPSPVSMCAPQKAERIFAPKERERSAVRRKYLERAPAREHVPTLRPARLTALHCGVFNPWGPACLWPGGVRRFRTGTRKAQGTSPGRHNAPGGRPKDSRDHDCDIVGAGADPHSHPVSPAGRPSSEWGYVRHTDATPQRQALLKIIFVSLAAYSV